jgi:hypothetical protein
LGRNFATDVVFTPFMKKLLPLIISGLLVGSRCFAADSVSSMNITQADVQRVLPLYHDISGLELVVASNVKHVYADITVDHPHDKALKKDEAMKLIETALIQQAGIVITRLDDKRVSVTYNDALKIVPQKNGVKK